MSHQPGTTQGAPYLSIVVTSRNDDHGGNLLGRMQLFVDTLREQGATYGLPAELILVEWNPPPKRPRLADALVWREFPGAPPVRIIEVPPEIHGRFDHADRLPLFQMIAKNVGIRRARGRFVLATNIDVVLSNELVRLLAQGRLNERRMYRVDRYDVPSDIAPGTPVNELLEYCRAHVIRVNKQKGTFGANGRLYHEKRLSLAPRDIAHRIVRGPWTPTRLARRIARPKPTKLHTNACGDFTLIARERWWELRGYPELQIFSLHLDSLLCHMAHHGGAREKVLPDPMRAYHLEHEHGSGWTPEGKDALAGRLSDLGVPVLDKGQFRQWAVQAKQRRRPIMFNDEDWGLAREDLSEVTIP